MSTKTIVCAFCVITSAIAVQSANGAILGFEGARIIHVGPGTFDGDNENNVIVGSSGNDILNGNGGNDYIIGGLGNNDTLRGHDGNDILLADNYLVGDHNGDGMVSAVDTQIWNNHLGQSGVIVSPPGISYVPGDSNLDGTVDASDEPVPGERFATINDGVVGTSNDTLYGGAGNDLLYAGKGLEFLWGGSGADVFFVTEVQDLSLNKGTVIEDFSVSEGDVLDISSIMQAYDPLADLLGDFLWIADTGTPGQAVVMVDQNGFSDGVNQYVPNILATSLSGPFGGGASEAQLQQLVDDGVLQIVGTVPEPSTLILAAIGMILTAFRKNKNTTRLLKVTFMCFVSATAMTVASFAQAVPLQFTFQGSVSQDGLPNAPSIPVSLVAAIDSEAHNDYVPDPSLPLDLVLFQTEGPTGLLNFGGQEYDLGIGVAGVLNTTSSDTLNIQYDDNVNNIFVDVSLADQEDPVELWDQASLESAVNADYSKANVAGFNIIIGDSYTGPIEVVSITVIPEPSAGVLGVLVALAYLWRGYRVNSGSTR